MYLKKFDYFGEEIWRVLEPDHDFGSNLEWVLDSLRLRGFSCEFQGKDLQALRCRWGWDGAQVSLGGVWQAKHIPDMEFFDWVQAKHEFLPLERTVTVAKDGWKILRENVGSCWIDPKNQDAIDYAQARGWNVCELQDLHAVTQGVRLVWGNVGAWVNVWLPNWQRDLLYSTFIGSWREERVEKLRALIPLSHASHTVDFREKRWEFHVEVAKKDRRWVWLNFCSRRNFMKWAEGSPVFLVGAVAKDFQSMSARAGSRMGEIAT
jgi:hypothetical protein